MTKRQIRTDSVREPMGHFSQAIETDAKGKLVFISGMTARRADGTIAAIGDIEGQTRQVCEVPGARLHHGRGDQEGLARLPHRDQRHRLSTEMRSGNDRA
jgi:2-iminobutanoate/2-iminopropanoate deaminase